MGFNSGFKGLMTALLTGIVWDV